MISNVLLWGLAALFLYGLFSSGRYIYRSYQDHREREASLDRVLVQLPRMGFQRLRGALPDQEEIRQILDRYYVLRSTKHPIVELKATSAFGGNLGSFPAYFLITYEKIDIFGAPVGAGGRSSPSEFQGTVAAVRMPLTSAGRTMAYRQPKSNDNDNWDWWADAPLLGTRSVQIREGLTLDFSREFSVRSTNRTATISPPVQELLLKNKNLFVNSFSRRSALVVDERGWAYVTDGVIDEETLSSLMVFQADLKRIFKQDGRSPRMKGPES